ncbi:hypothetical protein [Roseibium aggregatum]|uniref:hypothetical protein n=1 Tax=Roseibium aggregatum TaxID=187304 RepID=UPI001E5CEC05|nr:hypothetical protein [Roseibium aggregatum]
MNVWGKIVTKGYEFGARSNKTGVTEWFCLNDSEETKGRPEGASNIPEDQPDFLYDPRGGNFGDIRLGRNRYLSWNLDRPVSFCRRRH